MKTSLLLILSFATVVSAFAQSPLANARTLEIKEKLGQADLTVQIEKPDKVKVVLSNNHGKDGVYVCDGTNAYEYHKWSNTYQQLDLGPDGKYHCVLLDLAAVDLIMNGFKAAGPQPVVTHETVDGKSAILSTVLGAQKGKDGKTYQNEQKLWTDASTGLPLRRALGVIADGKEQLFQDLTFTSVTVDAPVHIAWEIPAGATEGDGGNLLKAGTEAPNFAAVTADGKTVHLADYRGKVVVLDFWATWCVPCQKAMPHLEKIWKELGSRDDVVVLGICVWDEQPAYKKWVAAKKGVYTFATAYDLAGRGKDSIASGAYHVEGIPTQYVIDKDGKVVAGYIAVQSAVRHPLEDALKKVGVSVE